MSAVPTQFRPRLEDWLLGALCPARCLICGETVQVGVLICPTCQAGLPEEIIRRTLCLADGRPLEVIAALPYEGGFRQTLLRMKFREERGLAKPVARLSTEAARAHQVSFSLAAYVCKHKEDWRKHGCWPNIWRQSWESPWAMCWKSTGAPNASMSWAEKPGRRILWARTGP